MFDNAKKMLIRKAIISASEMSDEGLVRIINRGERFFVRDSTIKKQVESVKKAIMENTPTVQMARNAMRMLSPKAKEKLVDNLLINAAILGIQKRHTLEEKLGFGLPWFFVISPTAKCNLSCIGCYAGGYQQNEGLPFSEVDRIFTEAKQLGIYFITVSGGEPFIWPKIYDLFKKHDDMYFQVYTNGTMLNKKNAKRLAELGNVAPGISIEGSREETDNRRGAGIYDKVMEAMDNLTEAGVLHGFSVTMTKLNADTLTSDEFYDQMIAKKCSFGWLFQYVPIGRKPDVSLMATPEQRNKLRLKVQEIRNKKPIFLGDFWNDGEYVGGCLAGARPGGYFHINCEGDVEPCVFLQFSVDNIRNKHLLDVMESPFFKALRHEQPYNENGNLLMPCALIDNPEILRKIVKKYNAKPSYNSSLEAVTDKEVTAFLDRYSRDFKNITDPVWEEMKGRHKHWKEYWGKLTGEEEKKE